MLIGAIAAQTGASSKAIRHYEAIGLLRPAREASGYRVFDDRDVHVVNMIREAQRLGFKLAELKAAASDDEPLNRMRVLELIRQRQVALALELERIRQQQRLLSACEAELLSSPPAEVPCDDSPAAEIAR